MAGANGRSSKTGSAKSVGTKPVATMSATGKGKWTSRAIVERMTATNPIYRRTNRLVTKSAEALSRARSRGEPTAAAEKKLAQAVAYRDRHDRSDKRMDRLFSRAKFRETFGRERS